MGIFNKINDVLVVDTFKNIFQKRSSEILLSNVPNIYSGNAVPNFIRIARVLSEILQKKRFGLFWTQHPSTKQVLRLFTVTSPLPPLFRQHPHFTPKTTFSAKHFQPKVPISQFPARTISRQKPPLPHGAVVCVHAFAGGKEATGKSRISVLLTFNLLSMFRLSLLSFVLNAWRPVDIVLFAPTTPCAV